MITAQNYICGNNTLPVLNMDSPVGLDSPAANWLLLLHCPTHLSQDSPLSLFLYTSSLF